MSSIEIAPLSTPFSKILVSAAPASMARVTNSVFSSWIAHSLSSIFSCSSASGRLELRLRAGLDLLADADAAGADILQRRVEALVAARAGSASGPLIRMPSLEIS